MKQFLASATVDNSEVKLVKEDDSYFIYWGVSRSTHQTKTQLLTPSGRKPSQSSVHKQFLQAVKALNHVKFSKI